MILKEDKIALPYFLPSNLLENVEDRFTSLSILIDS